MRRFSRCAIRALQLSPCPQPIVPSPAELVAGNRAAGQEGCVLTGARGIVRTAGPFCSLLGFRSSQSTGVLLRRPVPSSLPAVEGRQVDPKSHNAVASVQKSGNPWSGPGMRKASASGRECHPSSYVPWANLRIRGGCRPPLLPRPARPFLVRAPGQRHQLRPDRVGRLADQHLIPHAGELDAVLTLVPAGVSGLPGGSGMAMAWYAVLPCQS